MKRLKETALAALSAVFLTACATSVSERVSFVSAKVDAGELTGYIDDGIYTFKGIPYAVAERFRAPEPVTAYESGRQLALLYGAVSPQAITLNGTAASSPADFATPKNLADQVANEKDVLNLNVWTKDMSASLPVIVFFHGGGLMSGSSSELSAYEGSYMVKNHDVVFVSVNHRLGPFGYLDLSAYGDEYADSARVGTLDTLEALRWVQKNIAAFGGNPGNVTIAGQSGGGRKAVELAVMDEAVGLFDKVFMMSGAYQDNYQNNTQKLVSYLGLRQSDVISTLLSMSAEELLIAASNAGCSWSTYYGEDDIAFPLFDENGVMNRNAALRKWMWGTTYSEFDTNGIRYIMSADPAYNIEETTDESAMKALEARYGDDAASFAAAYKNAYPSHKLAEALYLSDDMGEAGLARKHLIEAGGIFDRINRSGATVYSYVVAYTLPYFGGVTMHHSGDIAFWFDSVAEIPALIRGDEKSARAVAAAMSEALASFAEDGDPGTKSLEWKPYTLTEHNTMVFDSESALKTDFDAELYKIMARHL